MLHIINGGKLSHIRFADDLVVISDKLVEAKDMLKKLELAFPEVGLNINISKNNFCTNLVKK